MGRPKTNLKIDRRQFIGTSAVSAMAGLSAVELAVLDKVSRGEDLTPLDLMAADPSLALTYASYDPYPYQVEMLRSDWDRLLMLTCRQGGKSLSAAALALWVAWYQAPAEVLLLSPSLRQSVLLHRKCQEINARLGKPVESTYESLTRTELVNGSKIESLPGTEKTIRGFSSVKLLVVDEASFVPDGLYMSVRPMLSISRGRIVAISTPWVKQGWFYQAWSGEGQPEDVWQRIKAAAKDCRKHSPRFLAEERATMDPRRYAMEYECEFSDVAGGMFDPDDVESMFDPNVERLELGI